MSARLVGIILVICSTFLEALGQVALKKSAVCSAGKANGRQFLALGILCFASEALVWTFVLQKLEVSIAYPMNSLSFVVIALLSRLLLGEAVGGKKWVGVCLILLGTSMVGLG